jgi:hypothetical protein
MTQRKVYEGKGGDEFGRFNKLMDGLLSVPYDELQKQMAKDERKKEAKKKRVKKPASRASNDRED